MSVTKYFFTLIQGSYEKIISIYDHRDQLLEFHLQGTAMIINK